MTRLVKEKSKYQICSGTTLIGRTSVTALGYDF